MTERGKPSNEGYRPQVLPDLVEKGFQPNFDTPSKPSPNSGYQPVSTGENPANVPSPPDEL